MSDILILLSEKKDMYLVSSIYFVILVLEDGPADLLIDFLILL